MSTKNEIGEVRILKKERKGKKKCDLRVCWILTKAEADLTSETKGVREAVQCMKWEFTIDFKYNHTKHHLEKNTQS